MRIIPKGERMYVVLEAVGEKQVGRIVMPETHSELTRTATVRAVGELVTQYKVGDRIIMSFNAGRTINTVLDGFTPKDDTHRIIVEGEVLALIVEDESGDANIRQP